MLGVLLPPAPAGFSVVLLIACAAGSRAAADDHAPQTAPASGPVECTGTARERALDLFERSAADYDRGELDTALELLERAYALCAEPVLVYNMGRVHERRGERERALASYRRYLELVPDADNRGDVERSVARLSSAPERAPQAEQPDARAGAAPAPQAAPASHASRYEAPWPWIVMGAGAAGVVAGLVLTGLARARLADAESDPTHRGARAAYREGRDLTIAANVTLVVSGVVGAAGVTWLLLTQTSAPAGGEELQLVVGGRF